ncbi:MAG: hypothetical protein ACRD8W_00415 [Nitrososphaeraceae archaeon]
MRPILWPENVEGKRFIIGESDPTRDDVRPCEYILGVSHIYMGLWTYNALIELSDEDREAIANGGQIILTLDGAEMPWSLTVIPNQGKGK